MFRIPFAFCLIVGGCGGGASNGDRFVVYLYLPASLSRTEPRRAGFLSRALNLELEVVTRSGVRKSVHFPPTEWERIALPAFEFPASSDDILTIRAKIWDVDGQGNPRSVPALVGRATLKAQEVAGRGPTVIHVRLSLQVSVGEYD